MKTSENGGLVRRRLTFSTPSRSSTYSRHCQPSRRMFFRITFVSYLAAVSIRCYNMSVRMRLNPQPHSQWTKLPLRSLHFSGSRPVGPDPIFLSLITGTSQHDGAYCESEREHLTPHTAGLDSAIASSAKCVPLFSGSSQLDHRCISER
jgi:hypothetical protein